MIAGKVMMDRNAPDYLCETAEAAYEETKTLIQKWHHKGRLRYAVTPRFAITSTPEQLRKAGELLKEFPDVYMHTHISENVNEVAWVKALFPDCDGYLDAYDKAGLVKERCCVCTWGSFDGWRISTTFRGRECDRLLPHLKFVSRQWSIQKLSRQNQPNTR